MNETLKNCMTCDPLTKRTLILLLNVHGIITIIALLGSYFVIRAFHKFRNLRTASNNILVSLSIADGLLAIPLILDIIQLCLDYNGGNLSCILKRVRGTVLFLPSVIVLHLTLMSSERFIAIKFALIYQAIVTKRRARIVSIVMWLWALVVTVAVPKVLQRATTGKDFREQIKPPLLVFQAVSMCVVPVLIILCSYTYIFMVSYKQRQLVREQGCNIPGMSTVKYHMKVAHTLAIVVALCLLSIIPMLAVPFLRVFRKSLGDRCRQKLLKQIFYYVAIFVNAICIPLIYGWKNEEFRNAFRKILKCC
ncbi:adenosine receptor A2b-like [Porites lutea]